MITVQFPNVAAVRMLLDILRVTPGNGFLFCNIDGRSFFGVMIKDEKDQEHQVWYDLAVPIGVKFSDTTKDSNAAYVGGFDNLKFAKWLREHDQRKFPLELTFTSYRIEGKDRDGDPDSDYDEEGVKAHVPGFEVEPYEEVYAFLCSTEMTAIVESIYTSERPPVSDDAKRATKRRKKEI